MSAREGAEGGKRKWPKKRKTFLSNAKKYARKGQLGRGTKMPEETYQYFVGILEVMQKGVETEEEKQTLVNNVLDRTRGEEISIVGNQLGCRVIELLLPYASAEDLERYMDALTPELRRLCADNFSSHVIEKLLMVACERATENLQVNQVVDETSLKNLEDSDDDTPKKKRKMEPSNSQTKTSKYTEEHLQKCHEFTLKICKYALNNLEDFVFDNYSNHILRSVIKCMSGITLLPGEKLKKNIFKDATEHETLHKSIPPHQTQITYKIVPEEFKAIVKDCAERLSLWPQFKDLPYRNLTSGLLQVLLFAIKNVDKTLTKNILKKLLNESFAPEDNSEDVKDEKKILTYDKNDVYDDEDDVNDDKNNVSDNKNEVSDDKKDVTEGEEAESTIKPMKLPPVFTSEAAVRLLEAALFVAKKKTYTQIYARCFIGRLTKLVTMPMLNFTVQRLFDNCQVKEELEMMFDEVSPAFKSVLACGNTGVLVSVAKACLRIKSRQSQFIASLEAALDCSEPDRQQYLPVLCLRLLPYDRVDLATLHQEYFINIHGSVVLQTLLRFQRPTKVVSGLLELTPEQLLVVLSDAKGCHVADAFFQGEFVGVKSRDKMVWKLKGTYQRLAMSQYGSRAFEAILNTCTPEQKVKIMTELSDKGLILNSTPFGRLIGSKLNIELFKTSQEKWKATLNKADRTKDIFKDIIEK